MPEAAGLLEVIKAGTHGNVKIMDVKCRWENETIFPKAENADFWCYQARHFTLKMENKSRTTKSFQDCWRHFFLFTEFVLQFVLILCIWFRHLPYIQFFNLFFFFYSSIIFKATLTSILPLPTYFAVRLWGVCCIFQNTLHPSIAYMTTISPKK